MKLPIPEESLVFLSAIVGLVDVLQHTPRDVTADSPSEFIFPPQEAVVEVILVTSAVVRTGTSSFLQPIDEQINIKIKNNKLHQNEFLGFMITIKEAQVFCIQFTFLSFLQKLFCPNS